MRRLDRLPAAVIAGIALDLTGMLVFVTALDDAWRAVVIAPALIAAGAYLVAQGARQMDAPTFASWMSLLTRSAGATALVGAPAIIIGGNAMLVPALLVLLVGLLHAALWTLCVPFAHPRSPSTPGLGADICAGVTYGALAACAFFVAPIMSLSWRGPLPVPTVTITMMAGAFLWAAHWLAPRAAADCARDLAALGAAAGWGALGLVAAPFVVAAGPGSRFLEAWLVVAAIVSAWLAATAWQLRAVALGAAGLAALLVVSIATASLPEPAIMAAATLGWIAIVTRAGAHRVIDAIAVVAGVALTVATATGLSSVVLVPELRARDARGLLLVAAPTLLRSAYLAALALRAIRSVDDLAPVPVPRAIART
jgi:hypothetical protein